MWSRLNNFCILAFICFHIMTTNNVFDYVDHTYRDYSKIPIIDADSLPVSSDLFPMKLHEILSKPEFAHIVSWMPHGRSWKVHRRGDFELIILPRFFDHCKYDSFLRQVNGWAYKRLSRGIDQGSYYHEVRSV